MRDGIVVVGVVVVEIVSVILEWTNPICLLEQEGEDEQ